MTSRSNLLVWLSLSLILLVGGWLRFTHLDWDGMNQLHPDERAILFVASQIHLPPTLSQALDSSQSPLNPLRAASGIPQSYPYGHLPLYTAIAAQRLVLLVCRACAASGEAAFIYLTYAARAVSALSDTLFLLPLFLLTRRLFGSISAILAAAFGAFAVLHIQNAHFGTVDAPLTLFVTLTLWLLVRYADASHRRDTFFAGICIGLGVGCKATAILLIIPLLTVHWDSRSFRHYPYIPYPSLRDPSTFWLTMLVAALAFALTNPYTILDPGPFLSSIVVQAQVTSGAVDWPYTRQFAGSIPIWRYVDQQVRWYYGPLLTLAAYTGLAWTARRMLRDRSRPLMIIVSWAAAMLLTVGVQYVKFPRYMMPLSPVLFACGAGLLIEGLRRYRSSALKIVPPLAVLISTALYAFTFVGMYRAPHPWVAASLWMYRDLPAGTVVISEEWDDPLPLDMWIGETYYLRERSFDSRLITPFDKPDDLSKLDGMLEQVSAADYIILSSNRLYGVIPRLRDRYSLSSAYYRALFSGSLGFTFDRSFSRYPHLFGLALLDDPFLLPGLLDPRPPAPMPHLDLGPADEAYTVYDHPLVLVFRNTSHLTLSQLRDAILQESQYE